MTVMLSGAVGGRGAKLQDKMFAIAAHQLEAAPEDIELFGGMVPRARRRRRGRDVATPTSGMKAYWYKLDLPEGMESGLEARLHLRPPVSRRCPRPTATTSARSIR